jgi:hypothetical protein
MQTLYESWQLRRALVEKHSALDPANTQAQTRILDFLLTRYANDSRVNEAAHFPARTELRIDRRAMVVHEHIGRGVVSGIKTEAEATDRASRILKRISRLDPQSSVSAPGHGFFADPEPLPAPNVSPEDAAKGGIAAEPPLPPGSPAITYRQRLAWGRAVAAIRAGESVPAIFGKIGACLKLGPTLPKSAVVFLFEMCDNANVSDATAASMLHACNNAAAPPYALIAWRNRLATFGTSDAIGEVLRTILLKPDVRKLALGLVRPYLADVSAAVRIHAVKLLTELGGLEDIGLLLDLASLPPQSDEDPTERGCLLDAASRLSGAQSV